MYKLTVLDKFFYHFVHFPDSMHEKNDPVISNFDALQTSTLHDDYQANTDAINFQVRIRSYDVTNVVILSVQYTSGS